MPEALRAVVDCWAGPAVAVEKGDAQGHQDAASRAASIDHTEGLRTHIERSVSTAAQTLARLALDAGQADLALWAARQGHAADPLDETVAAAALDAAAATGRPGAVRAEWTAITRDLAAHELSPSPELTAIYHHHRLEKETT